MNEELEKVIKNITKELIVGSTINVFSLLSIILDTVIKSDWNDLDKLKAIKSSLDNYVEKYSIKESNNE